MTETEYNQKIMTQNIELAAFNASLNALQVLQIIHADEKLPSDIRIKASDKIRDFVGGLEVIKAS